MSHHDTHINEKQQDGPLSLWTSFTAARNEEDYYQGWLELQSGLISGVVQSLLIIIDAQGQFRPVAGWPRGGVDTVRLSNVVERALDERCGLLVELETSGHYALAYPVFIDGQLHGVAALEVSTTAETELQRAMEQLQWGTAWLELLVLRQQADENKAKLHRLKTAVDLLAVTLGKESFSSAAMAFTTELAVAAGCERVSLGFKRNKHIVLQAVSHSAEIGKKMNLTRAIERVMEEAVLQRREIVYPALDDEVLICREHEDLSRQQSMASVVTFPLYIHDCYSGALTCERGAAQPFLERDIEFVRAVAALVGPALQNKYANDRSLPAKIKLAGQRQLEKLIGAGHIGRKLIALTLIGIIVFFSLATGNYRLTADSSLEGLIRRAIVVPFDGYIDQALVRAGDLVEKGDTLSTLDDRDLRLEKLAKHGRHRKLSRQLQEAVANHDRAQAGIIKAQLEQSQAELDLLNTLLKRTLMISPFAGLVVSGDLSQRLGGAVEKGEVLFEVTPLHDYRVILKVDERRIADVQTGQHGILVLFSLPHQKYPFIIDKITPIAQAGEGRNFFRVEARLQYVDESLRPGMKGVGKIMIDRRKLISIWTRNLTEWWKLFLWKWLP